MTKDKKTTFDNILAEWIIERHDQKALAKNAMYLALNRYPNIAEIEAYFDGCGDSGQVESIAYGGLAGEAIAGTEDLDSVVEDYIYSILPGGWEINDGSFGTIRIDVKARTADCSFTWRTTEDASFTEE